MSALWLLGAFLLGYAVRRPHGVLSAFIKGWKSGYERGAVAGIKKRYRTAYRMRGDR